MFIDNIRLKETPKTPTVSFNAKFGKIELKGRSIPENPKDFYTPLNRWLEEYSYSPNELTTVNIKLEYFNTSSSKYLMKFFKLLEKINDNGGNVRVNWFCEEDDEEMKEAGEDFNAISKLPFNIVKIKETISI